MSYIDPFAPAGSSTHPNNFRVPPRGQEQAIPLSADAMPHWIRLEDEPVRMDNPDVSIIGQRRWEEYRELLELYGTPEQNERMFVRSPFDEERDANMPTLADLKARHAAAQAPPVTAEDDLAAKLKALEEAGL